MDELIEIVDDQNNVLGTSMKSEAHKKGLLHRTVIAEIKDNAGNWILVKQAGDRQDPGQYVSPVGGHVSAGETPEEALRREANEEVGFMDFDFKFIGQAIFNRTVNGKIENHLFLVYEIYSDNIPILNHESVSFRRFSPDALKSEMKRFPEQFGDAWYFVVNKFYKTLLE